MQAATVGASTGRCERKKGRFAPALLVVLAVVAFACTFAVAASARPHSSMESILTRIHLRKDRLWGRHARRVHADPRDARAAIVGGSRVSIEQAPWQVAVIAFLSETEALLCGGSILNETEVLTAGHCVFNPSSKTEIPPEDIVVEAGTENVDSSPEQASLADGLRVHPYYNPSAPLPEPDDVAVLRLKRSLVFDGDVQPIAPIAVGSLLPEGTAVHLSGFGQQNPEDELNGELYGIGMTLTFSRECGGEINALFLCASSPDGSSCAGDSGGALTLPGTPATLAGVDNVGQVINGKLCQLGAITGFANIAAPEIWDFVVDGDENPPRAPRGGGAVIRGVPTVGQALSCEPGNWSNSPTYTYIFINSSGGEVLQRGSSSAYALTAADIGRSILCEVLATTAGGTGVGRTPALGIVKPSRQEEAAKLKQEEEAAAVKRQQEEEAAKHKRAEEEAGAKGGVLAAKETAKPKSPTRAQLLAKALKACRKQPTKHRRAQCKAQALRKYSSRKRRGKGTSKRQ
jgi:hypothetical protein